MAKKSAAPINPKEMRLRLRLTQTAFWGRCGVQQTTASRYESGRPIPKPTQTLLAIAYGSESQAKRIVEQLRGAA